MSELLDTRNVEDESLHTGTWQEGPSQHGARGVAARSGETHRDDGRDDEKDDNPENKPQRASTLAAPSTILSEICGLVGAGLRAGISSELSLPRSWAQGKAPLT